MTDSTVMVEAPGKLILLGEYAVLEQAPALVASVNRRCLVQIKSRLNPGFEIEAANLNFPPIKFTLDEAGNAQFASECHSSIRNQLNFALSILKYVTRKIGKNLPGADIYIDTADFFHKISGKKFGLGSSAALTVAMLSAIEKFMGGAGWMKNLYREALNAHRNAQGKMGSGVDIAASTLGGVLKYQMPTGGEAESENINNIQWPDNLYMISIWTGYSVSTRTLVRKVHQFRDNKPAVYQKIMADMSALSEAGCTAFQEGNIPDFLQIITDFVDIERKLSAHSKAHIISTVHEQISNLVVNAGGCYKPSGAGGGDIGVAFCDTKETYDRVLEAVKSSPYEILDLAIQTEGVKHIQPYEVS